MLSNVIKTMVAKNGNIRKLFRQRYYIVLLLNQLVTNLNHKITLNLIFSEKAFSATSMTERV